MRLRNAAVLLLIFTAGLVPAIASCATTKNSEPWKYGPKKVKAPWRALADYPRPPAPDTGWGMHDVTDGTWVPKYPDAFFKELKDRYGICWYKVLACCGNNKVEEVQAASRHGVEAVVRIYNGNPHPYFPRPGDEEKNFRRDIREYVAAGAHYFEAGNEPNLGYEWGGEKWDKTKEVELLCEQWLRVKKIIQEEGGIPVFYAMTPGSAGEWWQKCFDYYQKNGKLTDAFAGAAFGAHLGTLNHPLDYPFDPQKNMPHATEAERYQSLLKDNTCYNAGQLIMLMMHKYLPYPIPILSTEGGVWVDDRSDRSYPQVTLEVHTKMAMEMFNRFNPKDPNYWGDPLFAQMCWEYRGWFQNDPYGKMPALTAMEKAPKFDRGIAFGK